MNKLLFFFLTLLMNISAFSMEEDHQKLAEQSEKVDPKIILKPFNEETQKIKNFMINCYEICAKAERDTTHAAEYKLGFEIEHDSFEKLTNNLYSTFLIKQTTARICVGDPDFNALVELTKNIASEIEKLPKKNDHIEPFSETVAGLLESLKHAKAQVEK